MASLIQKVRKIFHNTLNSDFFFHQINQKVDNIFLANYIESLRDKVVNSTKQGISSERYCDHEIIVSLTTFEERIHNVHLAIESIMQGTLKPNKIILWLAEDEFKGKRLPRTLLLQQQRGLEIDYCQDLKSYNKLIPTLQKYPNDSIITIDDDAIYGYDLVERLVNTHIDNPNTICSCRMHRIKLNPNNKPISYSKWDFCIADEKKSPLNFPTGVGGVLYPPHCFTNDVFNKDTIKKICPDADDIWFYAMALIKGTKSKWVKNDKPGGYYIPIPTIGKALSQSNWYEVNGKSGNDIQFENVIAQYNLIELINQSLTQF